MTIYTHSHHIIPKHAGGTDDPSNLVQLTVEEHALAHKKLYEEHSRWQDKVAWLGLSSQIDSQEATRLSQSEGGKLNTGMKHSDETKRKYSEYSKNRTETHRRKIGEGNLGKMYSDETKQKMSLSAKNQPPRSAEYRRNISEAKKGTNHWSWVAHTYG